jgi:RNA polymerase subunit RPABC4/transcription elongation factor Spt4
MQSKTCIQCSYLTIRNTCRLTGKPIQNINGLSPDCPKGKE